MTNHRQIIPISQKLFSLLEAIEEVGEIPCQNFPDLFFPYSSSWQRNLEDTRDAKKLCQECPLIDQCRMYALEANEPFGIWGGLTAEERQRFRRTISSRLNL